MTRFFAAMAMGAVLFAGVSAAATGAEPADRACTVAERGWNNSGIGVENKTVRRVLKAFDRDGVPRRLKRIADRLVSADDTFSALTTLVGACRRLGYLPD